MTLPLDRPDAAASTELVLDNPAWDSLTGAHARFAEGGALVKRYQPDVSPIIGVRSWTEPGVWDALRDLAGERSEIFVSGDGIHPPEGWSERVRVDGVQLVETPRLESEPFDEAVELGPDDVADMLAIVARNQPGPFAPRTHELGRYVGVRRDGRLVAMAGERQRPEGWTEISAVSTDPDHRGQGLASRLVRDVAHHIRARGDRAFLHTGADNAVAIRTYERLGFALRRRVSFVGLVTP